MFNTVPLISTLYYFFRTWFRINKDVSKNRHAHLRNIKNKNTKLHVNVSLRLSLLINARKPSNGTDIFIVLQHNFLPCRDKKNLITNKDRGKL
jgi:hypothetical protein